MYMNFKRIAFTVVVLSVCSMGKDITGAAGINLGDVMDVPKNSSIDAPYRVTPINPISGYSDYGVNITPKTHKVHQIIIQKYYSEDYEVAYDMCKEDVLVLSKILKQKYPKAFYTETYNGLNVIGSEFNNGFDIVQGHRNIKAICSTTDELKVFINLLYGDNALYDLSLKEKAELLVEKSNMSGL